MAIYLVYGKGGHGRVVEDTIHQIDPNAEVKYFDDISNPYNIDMYNESLLIIAIGNNEVRKAISQKIGHSFNTVIHPTAYVSPSATIGEGTVVLANAVIQANASIGKHCIINANVTIDHDAILGDFVCTYPGSYVAGFANVGSYQTLQACQVVGKGVIL